MNREIKFRVWDGALKNWQQEIVFPTKFAELEPKYVGISFPIYPIGSENRFLFQQYTGLKDKNGKEVYEGDILTHGKTYPALVVNWNPRTASFNIGNFSINTNVSFSIRIGWLEVIGNIHENPELIK